MVVVQVLGAASTALAINRAPARTTGAGDTRTAGLGAMVSWLFIAGFSALGH